ncbi:hypothetical protein NE237_002470 [Protea cynaroides]|uniref:Uncharacterized protein n=1 Tax=Protea cynaroides TaxID=273540 RepID=A0A9Q0KW74_9MAGN|nr:hypothetical protein NE237_002470 [Protea cynaroides]
MQRKNRMKIERKREREELQNGLQRQFIINNCAHQLKKVFQVLGRYSFARNPFLSSYTSEALHQFKKTISAAKKYHHEVELFKHPHLLVLQVKNSFSKLPGGRLRPCESDTDGLKRKLLSKLSINEHSVDDEWEIGECLGMWWSLTLKLFFSHIHHPIQQGPRLVFLPGMSMRWHLIPVALYTHEAKDIVVHWVMEMRLRRQVQKY